MAISFPLDFPSLKGPQEMGFRMQSISGVGASPFTGEQQSFEHTGQWWELDVRMPPMSRADAEVFVAFLAKLKGRIGTFLIGDPAGVTPRGTWATSGAVLANGAHEIGAETIALDGFDSGATGKAGDWLQFGTGASTRLHKVLDDFTANGAGQANVEIWPALKIELADGAAVVSASAKGHFRLLSDERAYTIGLAQKYGVSFACMEAF